MISGTESFITWVYGDLDFIRRNNNWDTLRGLAQGRTGEWFCAGDFNDITHHCEKSGGRRKDQHKIDGFNRVIADLHMDDIGAKGQRFTWSNNRRGSERVIERLDRVIANRMWTAKFYQSQCINEVAIGSDHSPLVPVLCHKNRKVEGALGSRICGW